jgi:hypothetical protein
MGPKLGDPCATGGARSNVQSPSHSLRSCSGPAAAKPVFVKSVLANLSKCAADMRPARRGPMGTTDAYITVTRIALNAKFQL